MWDNCTHVYRQSICDYRKINAALWCGTKVENDNGYANIMMCINKCCKSGKIDFKKPITVTSVP